MKLGRRSFLKSSSLIMGGMVLGNNDFFSKILHKPADLKQLRDTVGIYNEKGGTIGYYVNDGMVVVIDSQFPDSVKNFIKELKIQDDMNIDYLFNTHHHGDHTSGNTVLTNYTNNIIAHVNCPRLQIKRNDARGGKEKIVTANLTFDNKFELKLPNEKISAIHFGQAHTGGDIVIHFENANIAHLGDLVFNNIFPYIDNTAECSVSGWIKSLDNIVKHFDKDTSFIFGHANKTENVSGDINDIIKQRNYLEALYNYVLKQSKENKSKEEIAASEKMPGFEDITESWEGAWKMNLKATFEQL